MNTLFSLLFRSNRIQVEYSVQPLSEQTKVLFTVRFRLSLGYNTVTERSSGAFFNVGYPIRGVDNVCQTYWLINDTEKKTEIDG